MRILAFVAIFGLAAGSVAPLHGQSLADVAKQEQQRRQTVKASGSKVYTNGDLASAPEPSPDPIIAAAASGNTASADKSDDSKAEAKAEGKTNDKAPAKDAKGQEKAEEKGQEYWSARMKALNDALQRDRLYAEALQTRVNSLTSDFSSRDD